MFKIVFPKPALLLMLAGLAASIAFYLDLFILDRSLLAEGAPKLGNVYLFRTALVTFASLIFIICLVQIGSKKNQIPAEFSSLSKIIAGIVHLLSLFFLFTFLKNPNFFYELGREGRLIERLSAVLYGFECGLFIYILFLLRKRASYFFIAGGLAFVFFLIAMEEISWFQRFLSYETPDLLKGNMQQEVNFHNYATNEIENAYYFSAFVFLILAPFVKEQGVLFQKRSSLAFFVPGKPVVITSAIFVAYNYDMWNVLFTQLSFFMTFFILVYYFWSSGPGLDKYFTIAVIGILAITQILFLLFGNNFVRRWGVTEYKEFLIPLAFLIYSFELLKKARL